MEAFRAQDVAGILALGDRPAAAAAYAARGLGVRYNHPAAVEACRSKLRMREVFRDAGLHVPWFRNRAIDPTPEPVLLGISYPCVLKPLSLSASQGVVRANNREEFLAAATRVRHLLPGRSVDSAPVPCDFHSKVKVIPSGSKSCCFVTPWNSPAGILRANALLPAS